MKMQNEYVIKNIVINLCKRYNEYLEVGERVSEIYAEIKATCRILTLQGYTCVVSIDRAYGPIKSLSFGYKTYNF